MWLTSCSRCQARQVGIILQIDQASLAVPDLRRVVEARAEIMHKPTTPITIHAAMTIAECCTHQTWIPSFNSVKFIFDDHARINVRLLNFVLNCVAIEHRAADSLAELHFVEYRTTYWTTVGPLDPRLQAGVVQVVFAWQEVGYGLVVQLGTSRLFRRISSFERMFKPAKKGSSTPMLEACGRAQRALV